jgi:hypothetical protein
VVPCLTFRDLLHQVGIFVNALDVALDGVDCSVGSNPLLETLPRQSTTTSSASSDSSSPPAPPVAVTASITQQINGLLNAAISCSPVTIFVRPSSSNVASFLQACSQSINQNLHPVHNYRRKLALQCRPQILAALSTPDDVKIGCDICVVAAAGLDDSDVGLDFRARFDVDVSVYVEDVRFKVKCKHIAVAAAVDMAYAAAGLSAHKVTNHIASIKTVDLNGSVLGTVAVQFAFFTVGVTFIAEHTHINHHRRVTCRCSGIPIATSNI